MEQLEKDKERRKFQGFELTENKRQKEEIHTQRGKRSCRSWVRDNNGTLVLRRVGPAMSTSFKTTSDKEDVCAVIKNTDTM